MRISDVKQQTVVVKLQAKSKTAFFLCKTLLYLILMMNHVIPADFFCLLTEICAKEATIEEPDKFLSCDRDLRLRPSVCGGPETIKRPSSDDKVPAELHRLFKCGLIGFAQETSGGQTKGREEEKLSSSPNA